MCASGLFRLLGLLALPPPLARSPAFLNFFVRSFAAFALAFRLVAARLPLMVLRAPILSVQRLPLRSLCYVLCTVALVVVAFAVCCVGRVAWLRGVSAKDALRFFPCSSFLLIALFIANERISLASTSTTTTSKTQKHTHKRQASQNAVHSAHHSPARAGRTHTH